MIRSTEVEVKVGIFVAVGAALIMLTILLVGGGTPLFQRTVWYHAQFPQVEGLIEGAIVKVAGVKVGQISKIELVNDSSKVDVQFTVTMNFKNAIHNDSTASIQTQGVLGDRYIVISTGTPASGVASAGAELKAERIHELKDYMNNADEILDRMGKSLDHLEGILDSFDREGRADVFFKNLTLLSTNLATFSQTLPKGMDHFYSIMGKIDKGQGTLGALVNDPGLYDDARTLLGGANRNKVLKYFIKKSVEDSKDSK